MNSNNNLTNGRALCLRRASGFKLKKPLGDGAASFKRQRALAGARIAFVAQGGAPAGRSARIDLVEFWVRDVEPLEAAA